MNGGWRAWRKGTALHYRKNCLLLNVNSQAGEDGVYGGRISVPVCPERRTLSESRECSGRKLVSVSYTHLDVYKRQIEAGGRGVGFPHVFAQALEYAVIEDGLEHVQPAGQLFIDVYKRQGERGARKDLSSQ